MAEEFISEPIEPVEGTFDTAGMTRGEPGLPGRFIWRDKEYTVAEVLEKWKESGPCKTRKPGNVPAETLVQNQMYRRLGNDNILRTPGQNETAK